MGLSLLGSVQGHSRLGVLGPFLEVPERTSSSGHGLQVPCGQSLSSSRLGCPLGVSFQRLSSQAGKMRFRGFSQSLVSPSAVQNPAVGAPSEPQSEPVGNFCPQSKSSVLLSSAPLFILWGAGGPGITPGILGHWGWWLHVRVHGHCGG